MRSAHTVAEVRAAEADLLARLPEGILMERAAAGLAAAVVDLLGGAYGARVLLLVGSGDNGGDALVAGAMLSRRGAVVEAVLLGENAHLPRFVAAGGRVVDADRIRRPDVVVDGIVGIGGRPGLRPEAVELLARVTDVPVVAVDVPSGVDVDTGAVDGPHVEAALTVTFGTHKVAHLVDPAAQASGAVHLVDIGLDLPPAAITSLQRDDVAALLPRPPADGHKYTRGVVGLRTGSATYPGAAVLGTAAASLGLCGMVRYAGGAEDEVRAAHPEIVVGAGRVQAWVVGSGGGDLAARMLAESVADEVPVVVDADALAHLAPGTPGVVMTPHAGELARLFDVAREEVEATPLSCARRAASSYDAVVLLKGPRTLVAHPDGRVRVNATGTPWLASAGSGDVLAGLIGSLLAAGLAPFDAAAVGAWLLGAAAQVIDGPLRAGDLPDAVRDVVADLLRPAVDGRMGG